MENDIVYFVMNDYLVRLKIKLDVLIPSASVGFILWLCSQRVFILTRVLLSRDIFCFENNVNPDQMVGFFDQDLHRFPL